MVHRLNAIQLLFVFLGGFEENKERPKKGSLKPELNIQINENRYGGML